MLTVIFFSLGTAIMFFQPKRFISAGTVSIRYFSCNRLFIAFFYLVLYLSNVVWQWRQLRTFVPSGKAAWPIRVCLPQLPQTTITFETLIPASFSTIPPLMFSDGLARIIDQHRGIIIKADIRAILTPPFFPHAHHNRFHYGSFLNLAFRCCFLHRGSDNIPEAGLQSRVAAHRHNACQLARAGIVGHRQPGSHLNHWFRSPVFLTSPTRSASALPSTASASTSKAAARPRCAPCRRSWPGDFRRARRTF